MKTDFLLMAQYSGKAVIPLEDVCRDYFPHLSPQKMLRKIRDGQLALPVIKIENSQKGAAGIHLADLAAWIDERRAAALRDHDKMYR